MAPTNAAVNDDIEISPVGGLLVPTSYRRPVPASMPEREFRREGDGEEKAWHGRQMFAHGKMVGGRPERAAPLHRGAGEGFSLHAPLPEKQGLVGAKKGRMRLLRVCRVRGGKFEWNFNYWQEQRGIKNPASAPTNAGNSNAVMRDWEAQEPR